ncbi:MAG: SAM-dependent methyltransferase [Lachnospiraceae bacterium]|nr:SAM-dependent methyltransferase [Lachnospiraceae bacterium]
MANNCQVPTPRKYVIQMLNYIKYKNGVFGKRVLENSCGKGNILVEIVKRYIDDARRNYIDDEQIVKGMERDIVAFEIDEEETKECIRRLNKLTKKMGLSQVHWNINNKDFLRQPREKYDYIIGNPPYITYHDIHEIDRKYLKEKFVSCEKGRFDYCYAFIEASVKSLKEQGKLVYLLPYSVVKNKFANKLREYLMPYITAIYDYAGIKIFPDAITSSVVLLMENKENKNYVKYHEILNKKKRKILRQNLNGRWNFADDDAASGQRLGDYFEVCNSVATLYNKAYIIHEYTQQDNFYYVDGMKIEKQIVYPAISLKSFNKKKRDGIHDTLILFPYKVMGGQVERYSPNEFEKKYPMATEYLKVYESNLGERKSDENSLWFEYGRSQAINRVFGEKLVIPMVVTNHVSVCRAGTDAIPYAGYFIKRKKNSTMTLDEAKKILESKEFYEYVKAYGTPTTPTSYRISVDDIKEYKF